MDDGRGRFVTAEDIATLEVEAKKQGANPVRIKAAMETGKGLFHEGETVECNGSQFCITRIEHRKSGDYLTLKLLAGKEMA